MQKHPFDTAELKSALERSLDFELRTFVRLGGASALNYKAVRSADGLTFAVKCSPPSRRAFFIALIEHLQVMDGQANVVCRLFADKCLSAFRGYDVICLSWCKGSIALPDELTEEQVSAFINSYTAFSTLMQRMKVVFAPRPIWQWRKNALAKCQGAGGGILRRILLEMEPGTFDYDPKRLMVIHGDFHHGNFRFEKGRVSGIFDLEEFRLGYPVDDIVRYFTCAVEHFRWYEQGRRQLVLKRFRQVIGMLPSTRQEWLTAINGRLIGKVYMRTRNVDHIGFFKALNLLWSAGIYRQLRRVVTDHFDVTVS